MSSPFICSHCGHRHNLSKGTYDKLISHNEDFLCGQCGKKLEPQKSEAVDEAIARQYRENPQKFHPIDLLFDPKYKTMRDIIILAFGIFLFCNVFLGGYPWRSW